MIVLVVLVLGILVVVDEFYEVFIGDSVLFSVDFMVILNLLVFCFLVKIVGLVGLWIGFVIGYVDVVDWVSCVMGFYDVNSVVVVVVFVVLVD